MNVCLARIRNVEFCDLLKVFMVSSKALVSGIWSNILYLPLLASEGPIATIPSTFITQGIRIFVPIHVDDLLASNSASAIQHVKSKLSSHFGLHDLGSVTSNLGMKIDRHPSRRMISLYQPGYIESILAGVFVADLNPSATPMDEGHKLSLRMSPSSLEEITKIKRMPYHELIDKILNLALATRPDIAYVVGVLCWFVEGRGREHWLAAKCVLHYLKDTVHMELVYSPTGSVDLSFVSPISYDVCPVCSLYGVSSIACIYCPRLIKEFLTV